MDQECLPDQTNKENAMSTITIVIQNAPYQSDNKAWHALRFAGAAMTEDMTVQVHLLDDGVEVGRKNHVVPEGKTDLEKLLAELIECGLKVRACGMALNDCAIDEDAMMDGVERGSMKALAAWVKGSDHVMVF
jgi:tRNA 2-thiouridine synthesizing protein D